MEVIILRNTKYLSMNGTRSFPDSLEPVFWKRDVRGSERLTKFGGKEKEEKGEGLVLLVYFKLRRFEAWKWLHGPRISIRKGNSDFQRRKMKNKSCSLRNSLPLFQFADVHEKSSNHGCILIR